MFPRVMVVIEQQCSCLHPLVWIGCKLSAQLPRPAPGSKTSTGLYLGMGTRQQLGLLASGRRPAGVVRPSSHCQMMKQRMQTSSDSSPERGDNWSRRSKVAPPCQQGSHHRPLQHRRQAAKGSSTKPWRWYWSWKKTRWHPPSTWSKHGRRDAPSPRHSVLPSYKYLQP